LGHNPNLDPSNAGGERREGPRQRGVIRRRVWGESVKVIGGLEVVGSGRIVGQQGRFGGTVTARPRTARPPLPFCAKSTATDCIIVVSLHLEC
jgi:hypothetical protein